jgi:hypothetical protein
MSEKRINEELAAVEDVLAQLKPAASGVDRDRVMFLAGRASMTANVLPRQHKIIHWLWPCITAVSLFLAIASSGMLFLHGTATGEKQSALANLNKIQTAENVPQPLWYEHTQKETPEVKRPRPSSGRDNIAMDYLSLNKLVVEKGVEALPGPLWIPIGPEKYPRRGTIMQDEWKMF